MDDAQQFKNSTMTLASGAATTISFPGGEWFALLLTNKQLFVSFDQGQQVLLYRGDVYTCSFTDVTVTNSSPVSVTFTVLMGSGDPPTLTGNRVPSLFQNQPDVSCGAGAATQVVTGSNSTRYAYLSIAAGAVGPVRIGGSTISATKGVWLTVGAQPLQIETSADIYVWNPQASAVPVSVCLGG
ncbi:MAG TPA: hypothetical protein VGG10_15295 [Rhizomicrobium sp.]|jgi:hypothetical protein